MHYPDAGAGAAGATAAWFRRDIIWLLRQGMDDDSMMIVEQALQSVELPYLRMVQIRNRPKPGNVLSPRGIGYLKLGDTFLILE